MFTVITISKDHPQAKLHVLSSSCLHRQSRVSHRRTLRRGPETGNGSKINNFGILTGISLLGWIVLLMIKIKDKSFAKSEIKWKAFRDTAS